MTSTITFRPYSSADKNACLAIFDSNCPAFFAPNERDDYDAFLGAAPGGYEVSEVTGRVVAAFGLIPDTDSSNRLVWIMLDPDSQGHGIGSAIMQRIMSFGRASQSQLTRIAASHKSAPFFARFGAIAVLHTKDGWGDGMDRVDMELAL